MARPVLVDTNVLMDVLSGDPVWLAWSLAQPAVARKNSRVVVNPIVCAEIAPYFRLDWRRLDAWLKPGSLHRESLPFEASLSPPAPIGNIGKAEAPAPRRFPISSSVLTPRHPDIHCSPVTSRATGPISQPCL
jgi:hypothetical protein